MSSEQENDSGSYDPTPQRRNAAIIGNPPHGGSYWSSRSHQESYMPSSPVPNPGYWSSIAVGSHSSSPYGGVFAQDQSINEGYLGSSFGVPGSSVDSSGNDFLMGMEAAPPISDDVNPKTESSMLQTYPPSLIWTPTHGEQWVTPSSWEPPVHHSGQFSDSSGSVASLVQPAAPPFQMAVSPVISGSSEFEMTPTGDFPMIASSNSVLPLDPNDPVAVTPHYRSLSEQADASNTTTFPCLWRDRTRGAQCTALIASDRKSVSSHLRDAHDFLCDGQMIECAWGECASPMQRRNIPRHVVSRHFEIKVECPWCRLPFSRADAKKKHQQACTGVRMPAVMEASEEEGRYF